MSFLKLPILLTLPEGKQTFGKMRTFYLLFVVLPSSKATSMALLCLVFSGFPQ